MRAGCLLASAIAAAFTFGGGRPFSLSSPAFSPGATIPRASTCDGGGASPSLAWTRPPSGTRSLALLVEDPDAPGGTFTHWVAWGIRAQSRSLSRGAHPPREGLNSAGSRGWLGPCPPSGTHHYVFRLYALGVALPLAASADSAALRRALRGHVLARAQLVGTYRRR